MSDHTPQNAQNKEPAARAKRNAMWNSLAGLLFGIASLTINNFSLVYAIIALALSIFALESLKGSTGKYVLLRKAWAMSGGLLSVVGIALSFVAR